MVCLGYRFLLYSTSLRVRSNFFLPRKALGLPIWLYLRNFKTHRTGLISPGCGVLTTEFLAARIFVVGVIYRDDFGCLLKKNTSLVCTGGCCKSSYFSISPLPLLWNQCPLTALLGFPSSLLSKVSVCLHQKTPSRAYMSLCSSNCLCRSC